MAEALKSKLDWLCCPRCGGKTRTQIRAHTVLEDFPLFCPKCRYTCVTEKLKKSKCQTLRRSADRWIGLYCVCCFRGDYGGNYEKYKPTDRLLRIRLRNLRCQNRNDHERQRPAQENRRAVDEAQRRNDHTGDDQLHRLSHRGRQNTFLRQALPCT